MAWLYICPSDLLLAANLPFAITTRGDWGRPTHVSPNHVFLGEEGRVAPQGRIQVGMLPFFLSGAFFVP